MRVGVAFGLAALAGFLATSAHASGRPDLDAVLARWDRDEHPDLRGVVVVRDGRRVAERYYNGASPSELHDIRSAGKSITALLVGIAIDRGAIASVDDPVSKYWPEASGSAIGAVPLRDVVSMRSGLAAFDEDPASSGNEDRMDASDNPMAFVRHIPSAEAPGTRYRYNSATAYTAGVVVAKATGETMSSFARARLFRPLGITRWDWQSDASGMTKGQGNLSLTTRELASIGEMVRNNGRFQGRQIVSALGSRRCSPRMSASGQMIPTPISTAISGTERCSTSQARPFRCRSHRAMAATRFTSSQRAILWLPSRLPPMGTATVSADRRRF